MPVIISVDRRLWFLALFAIVFGAACSSEGGSGEATGEPPASTSEAVASGSSDDGTLPIGTAWEAAVLGRFEGRGNVSGFAEAGDQTWVVGSVFNQPMVWRSADGVTWTETALPAREDGQVSLVDVVATPGGRLILAGNHGTRCNAYDGPNGYLHFDRCQRQRPVVYVSDDDGESWRSVEPASLIPPEDSSLRLASIGVHGELVVVGATVRGPDWHGRVYTSSDGEGWQLVSEVRGEEPWSVDDVLSDGATLVVLASAHPCSGPHDISEAGWVLGTAWPSHLRILAGGDATALQLLAPGEHPLAVPPVEVDCAEVQEIEFATTPYARAEGAVIDGAITLLERAAEGDEKDAESYERRVVSLVDGAWDLVGVMDLPASRFDDWFVGVEGAPALLAGGSSGTPGLAQMRVHVLDGTDGSVLREGNPPVFATQVEAGAFFGDALLAAGVLHDQPFGNYRNPIGAGEFVVWRSVPVAASEWGSCEPAPAANCRGADLEQAAGRLDFSGLDLAGLDLTLAQMDGANFDGASLAGALLIGAQGSSMTFTGADLTGADLRASDLADLAGADLTDADLSHATVRFSSAPTSLEGASLAGITLRMGRLGAEYGQLELSLAGFVLTNARFQGPLDPADGRLVITDLRGAVIDNTTFAAVDLSGADVTGVDLSGLRIDEDSICPDGEPPVVESFFGACE